jgi:NAD(P)-dependent dehydrogenase (short-subunit alcohol dehydrogenase family)
LARVLVTGSTEGLGLLAAQALAEQGHAVTLHARNAERAEDARRALPAAETVLVGELSRLGEVRALAERANASGRYDAVIHNAGVGYGEPRRETDTGVPDVIAVNVLAPYVLTALIERPPRLVYLSSGMHHHGTPDVGDLAWRERRWNGSQAYSDSKLYDVVLAFAVARLRPDAFANAVDPGWVPTRMGGAGAPDDLALGADTQVWLAVSDDADALVSGGYFFHRGRRDAHPAASDSAVQDALLARCASLTGVALS